MLETVGSVFESYEVQSVHRYIPTDTVKLSTKLYNVIQRKTCIDISTVYMYYKVKQN